MLVFLKFWHFSPEHKETGNFGATEGEFWIGNLNAKAWKTTKHKLQKIYLTLTKILQKFRKTSTPMQGVSADKTNTNQRYSAFVVIFKVGTELQALSDFLDLDTSRTRFQMPIRVLLPHYPAHRQDLVTKTLVSFLVIAIRSTQIPMVKICPARNW